MNVARAGVEVAGIEVEVDADIFVELGMKGDGVSDGSKDAEEMLG
ncbi:MAG: hypothetical protein WBW94_06970 [Anaerolineales bacterium]